MREKLLTDGEGAARQGHTRLAGGPNVFGRILQKVRHVLRIVGRPEGGHGLHRIEARGRLQHRGAAQRVPHEDARRLVMLRQKVRRHHQVVHVGGKIRVGEVAFALPQAREVEAEHRDAVPREGAAEGPGGPQVLGARKAVGKEGVRAGGRAFRAVEAGGERSAFGVVEGQSFGWHGGQGESRKEQSQNNGHGNGGNTGAPHPQGRLTPPRGVPRRRKSAGS
jgi:hypothetical protein